MHHLIVRTRSQLIAHFSVSFNKVCHRKLTMATNDKPLVAISQMRATHNKEENMRLVKECVERAAKEKACMLFLPECCDFVGRDREETLSLAEPLNGPLMQFYKNLANEFNIWLSLGGIHESIPSENDKVDKIHNAHVILDNKGEMMSVYRKLHLFDVDTPEFRFRESQVVTAGSYLVPPVKTPVGNLGLQICYDMRFAEPSILLRKCGAQLLTYPSAFAQSTGKVHWSILLQARAIENQCFVLAAAQIGWHNKKRMSWGHALAVSPWGEILADCGQQELDVKTVEIDLSKVSHVRSIMPCFEHRKEDVYGLSAFKMASNKSEVAQDFEFAKNVIDKRTVFYESTHCFAFTNLRCVVKGHVLVATKRIVPRLNGLTCAELSDFFVTVCRIQRMLEAYYNTTSATVTVQDGAEAGQTVPHVHFHVMPRRPGDFKENDQIYVKLEDQAKVSCDRTLEERVEEAERYKDFMENDYKFYTK